MYSSSIMLPENRSVDNLWMKSMCGLQSEFKSVGDECETNCDSDKFAYNLHQRPYFSIYSNYRKKGLNNIIDSLKMQQQVSGTNISPDLQVSNGDLAFGAKRAQNGESDTQLEATPTTTKQGRQRKRVDKPSQNGQTAVVSPADYSTANNNVKNERLSPGTPDNSSRSRSITPSSAKERDTPPTMDNAFPSVNRYSEFMRSLAARYNNNTLPTTDFFAGAVRNGFPPPLDPRLKSPFTTMLGTPHVNPHLTAAAQLKEDTLKKDSLNSIAGLGMLSPLIDMSSTQALMALVRSAKEADAQLSTSSKRPNSATHPLDLSAGAPSVKRARSKNSSSGSSSSGVLPPKRPESASPTRLQEDISGWTVDDVCNFVASIDICAEYAQMFREQKIDGAGLPLLTEEHLTTTINMKLGPALKLKSILAKKLGTTNLFSHCGQCHNNNSTSGSPDHQFGNTSDSGGVS